MLGPLREGSLFCSGPAFAHEGGRMEKILLDTDIGGDIDDALCLGYLLQEPRCQLLGITTVCGEPERRAAVADAICQSAGRRIPIVAGLSRPLQPIPLYPTPEGAGALARWPHASYPQGDAPAFLYQKLRENPGEITLIAIGNMTNIASLFRRYPDSPGLLKGLSAMNGYFGSAPLPEPWYNWNAWADPLASRIVFEARVARHRVFPLDVTGQLSIAAEGAQELFPAGSALMRAIFDFGSAWLQGSGLLTLHDPLAAVSVFYPELCRFERGNVQVETAQEACMGATRLLENPQGRVEVARSADKGRFYRLLSETLCRSQEPEKSAFRP